MTSNQFRKLKMTKNEMTDEEITEYKNFLGKILLFNEIECYDKDNKTVVIHCHTPVFGRIKETIPTIKQNNNGQFYLRYEIELLTTNPQIRNITPVAALQPIDENNPQLNENPSIEIASHEKQRKYIGARSLDFPTFGRITTRHSVWATKVPDVTTSGWSQESWDRFNASFRPDNYYGGEYDQTAWEDYVLGLEERRISEARRKGGWGDDPRQSSPLFGRTIHRNPLTSLFEAMERSNKDMSETYFIYKIDNTKFTRQGFVVLTQPLENETPEITVEPNIPPNPNTSLGTKILSMAQDIVDMTPAFPHLQP